MSDEPKTAKRSLYILVVDDDPYIRRAMQHTIQHLGHRSCLAWDGAGALWQIEREKPDLVLLDIGLGAGMNGIEVATRLPRGMPIVIISGRDPEDVRREALEGVNRINGVMLFIGKPIDESILKAAIDEVAVRGTPGPAADVLDDDEPDTKQ